MAIDQPAPRRLAALEKAKAGKGERDTFTLASSRLGAGAVARPGTRTTSERRKLWINQQTVIDTYVPENMHGALAMLGVGIAKLAACPPVRLTAADLLNDRVISFHDEHGVVTTCTSMSPNSGP